MRFIAFALLLMLAGCAADPAVVTETEPVEEAAPVTVADPDPVIVLSERAEGQGQDYHRRFSFEATADGYDVVRLRPSGDVLWAGSVSIVLIAPDGTQEALADGYGSEGIYGTTHLLGEFREPARLPYALGSWVVDVQADGLIDFPFEVELR